MTILKIILIIFAIIIAILLAIVLVIIFVPFEYKLSVDYVEDKRIDLKLNYIIFKIKGYLTFSPEVSYELKLGEKAILSSDRDEDEENNEDNSIEDTEFIENKNLSEEVKESKLAIKDLFASAKRLEKKKSEEEQSEEDQEEQDDVDEIEIADDSDIELSKKKEKTFNIIDKFKNIFKSDELYVIKKVANEVLDAIKILKPDKINVRIKYGAKDPFAMGLLFAIAAPIYSFLGKKLNIKKNSKSDLTEGHIDFTGHPRLYKLVKSIFNLLIDKKFRKVVFKKKKS